MQFGPLASAFSGLVVQATGGLSFFVFLDCKLVILVVLASFLRVVVIFYTIIVIVVFVRVFILDHVRCCSVFFIIFKIYPGISDLKSNPDPNHRRSDHVN